MVEDQVLIRRSLAGSQVAFQQLVERYQNYVFTVCMRVLRRREEAEETAQDAFIKAYNSLSTFQHQSQFSSWLYTIAYRTALDRARLKKMPVDSLDDSQSAWQLADTDDSSPSAALQREELQEELQAAIDRLSPIDASLITLYYLQEQSVKEIATITGLTETNVKTRLFRGREALRNLLGEHLRYVIN